MKVLHEPSPNWVLLSGREVKNVQQQVWPFFLHFVLARRPLPEFEVGNMDERKNAAARYFGEFFTQEKDLAVRLNGNMMTGFVLFDPQCWSLDGEILERTVELVIAGSLHGKPWRDAKDFHILIEAYKNYKGCGYIAMNINRQWKKQPFEKFCRRLGFKEKKGMYFL